MRFVKRTRKAGVVLLNDKHNAAPAAPAKPAKKTVKMSIEKIKIGNDGRRYEVRVCKRCIAAEDQVRRFSPFEYGSEEAALKAAEEWRAKLSKN